MLLRTVEKENYCNTLLPISISTPRKIISHGLLLRILLPDQIPESTISLKKTKNWFFMCEWQMVLVVGPQYFKIQQYLETYRFGFFYVLIPCKWRVLWNQSYLSVRHPSVGQSKMFVRIGMLILPIIFSEVTLFSYVRTGNLIFV